MEQNKKKVIGIDARFYGPMGKGIGRYTQEIVDRIIKLDTENNYVIFLSPENFDYFFCNNKRIRKVKIKTRWYTVAEQIIMPFLIKYFQINLMHFPHFNVPIFCPVDFIVTIHDLILTKFSTIRATTLNPYFYVIKKIGYKIVINLAIKRAKKIITVSEYTKKDIINYFRVKKDKIIVIYEGISDVFLNFKEKEFIDDKNIILKYNIHKPYILYVGNAYPHKNLENLIKSFVLIKEKLININLVLVGNKDYFYLKIIDLVNNNFKEIANDIIFTGYISDKDLKVLYRQAQAYVFPSLFEGFGLPPIEAMAHSCPVISSQETCLPEILGNAAVFFNPYDEQDIAYKVITVLEDENLRKEIIAAGFENIKKYNWNKCVTETLNIYKKCLKQKGG